MPNGKHGKSIKAPKVYDALRREGYPKAKAAAISNAQKAGTIKHSKGGRRR
jgi:hypothetical protein